MHLKFSEGVTGTAERQCVVAWREGVACVQMDSDTRKCGGEMMVVMQREPLTKVFGNPAEQRGYLLGRASGLTHMNTAYAPTEHRLNELRLVRDEVRNGYGYECKRIIHRKLPE